ncbi:MAG: isoleucine--tRNA ligase [Puniceicoccales bacterium]|jgi:isoleucyl-tRNA synthetase|nr:isoleucine--tRNA ligase [Puniceicoccales bacterium]
MKKAVNLPETKFPLRAAAATREPARIRHWQEIDLYGQIQKLHTNDPLFILHDGPPFTNGDVHIGTALNKALKDIIIRYKTMRGFRAPYVPGWDCHGLPIEHKVVRQMHGGKETLTIPQLRRRCAEFSREYSGKQRKQFERLGLLADWAHEYRTMDPAYEASVMEFFARCVDQNLVYRSKRPVYWSIPCRTALAEAEVEYKEISNLSIWVKFALADGAREKLGLQLPAFLVIWTTTPWTLPSNLAVAVNGEFSYVGLRHGDEIYIVETTSAQRFMADCHLDGSVPVAQFSGAQLAGIGVRHPFIDRMGKVLAGEFVTNDTGTGCVHIAPGHGMEDYILGTKNGLEAYSPIGDDGRYVADGRIPDELVGISVLNADGKCAADDAVIGILQRRSALLHVQPIRHSYPHCWRSKSPVIFRAMDQWFIRMDHDGLRQRVLDAIDQVRWIPAWGENRIRGAVEARPDWCISRQRCWGTPIPVFFDDSGNALLDGNVVRGIAEKFRKFGSDCWFEKSAGEILEGIPLPAAWHGKKLRAGTDTLDVWIDSGSSGRAVLREQPGQRFPADIYVEGSDQHRGWFQSSLWCSMIDCGQPPYGAILTHGFIVGEDRKKVSKSNDGKPQTSDGYVEAYGTDVIRLWISSEDFRNDITVSDGILQHVVSAYATIRNTLRYQLGNLHDFNPARDAIAHTEMPAIDRWALEKARQLLENVTDAYEKYEFHRIYRSVLNFCTVTLSATYHDILKDRLYTFGANWKERRSAQTVMHEILMALIAVLLPIIPFTADEAYAHLQADGDFAPQSAHLLPWPESGLFAGNEKIAGDVDRLLDVRAEVYKELELARQRKDLGKSLEAAVALSIPQNHVDRGVLERHRDDLAEIFIVSQIEFLEGGGDMLGVSVKRAKGERCSRCWRWITDGTTQEDGHYCPRCLRVFEGDQ